MPKRRTDMKHVVFLMIMIILLAASLTVVAQSQYSEAPQLAERVQDGELPPVEARLPDKPVVVEPVERIGKYGGDWRVSVVGGNYTHMDRYQGYENLLRWTPTWDAIIPNIAESYDVSEDSSEYTFHLREGMRWSDGELFTADDIVFWYEDVLLNEELTPAISNNWRPGGEVVEVTKIDDYTVKFTFAVPYGLFPQHLAEVGGRAPTHFAEHYFKQFHPKYNPNVDQLVREAGLSGWVELFVQRGGTADHDDFYRTTGAPVLNAWVLEVAPGEGNATRALAVRNPYYWKVDPDGNQLPYLDRITYSLVQEVQVLLLKVLSGEIDMMDYHFATPENKAVVVDNMGRGDYHLFTTTPTFPNRAVIQLNLNHADPVKREIFQNKDFRIGLSHAIHRQEIIDLVMFGQGRPHQAAPRPESAFYHERLAKQYTEYDVDLANEYLDKAGYTERDSGGYRLGPDGERITIIFEMDAGRLVMIDMLELVKRYWEDVGIDAQVRTMDRSLWEVRVRGDGVDYDASMHTFGGGTGQVVITDPRYYFPFNGNSLYARAWAQWYSNPDDPEGVRPQEPPAAAKRQMELYDELRVTGDVDRQIEIMNEILDIAADQFYVIGITTEPDGYGIVKNNFHNVPDTMPWSWVYPHPAPTNPHQFFKE